MDSASISIILAALIALVGAVYASQVTRRATRDVSARQALTDRRNQETEEAKIDGAAYDRAVTINNQVLTTLRAELDRTQALRDKDTTEYQKRISDLEANGVLMREDIRTLTRALIDAGVILPVTHTR